MRRVPVRLHAPKGGWPVRRAAELLGVTLAAGAAEAARQWLDRLCEWNARFDLTAARSVEELVDLMLADALVLSTRLAEGLRLIDVGTGAGAPGLALAILRPDLAVTLAEPLVKRTAFLRTVLGALGRLDVTIEVRSGEAVAKTGAKWDVALARATLAPPAWLGLAAELLAPGGDAWVFLAREEAPSHPDMVRSECIEYVWPLTGVGRTLVRYTRL